MTKQKSSPDLLREIVNQSLAHGIELLSHVELMEEQNAGGVNEGLADAGLNNVSIAIRNAIMTRVVLMVAREFTEPRETDRNLHRAINLLEDKLVKEVFRARPNEMKRAAEFFKKCKGDNRLNEIRHFRDKYTAHIGEPKETPLPKYKDLFSFARETVTCINLIANATSLAEVLIEDSNDAREQASEFWKPWRRETKVHIGLP